MPLNVFKRRYQSDISLRKKINVEQKQNVHKIKDRCLYSQISQCSTSKEILENQHIGIPQEL